MAERDETPTLFEWAGGREPLKRMLDAFYDRVEADELIAPMFPAGVTAEHRESVTTWWCEVFGGPADYTRDHGGYEHMLAKHRGLRITEEQRHRFVALLSLAADDAGLPADPEFRSALMAYAEWGTRLAQHNSPRHRSRGARAGAPLGMGRGPTVPPAGVGARGRSRPAGTQATQIKLRFKGSASTRRRWYSPGVRSTEPKRSVCGDDIWMSQSVKARSAS